MAKQKKSKMALYTRQDKIILYCGYALLGVFLLVHGISMLGDWCVAFRVKNFFRKWMGDMKTNADEIDG